MFDFMKLRNKRVKVSGNTLEIGDFRAKLSDTLDCGPLVGMLKAQEVVEVAEYYQTLCEGTCQPQLAALVFVASGNPRALDWYFPITNMLDDAEISSFYQFIQGIIQHQGLDLRLFGDKRGDLTTRAKADIPYIVGGHLAEIFFYRRDILERFLTTPRHIWLYATPRAFAQDGGLAGGDYNPSTESVQLVLSRLYEGFSGETPGVAPFLHEFGHMLDYFEADSGKMGGSEGLLPGLSPQDGAIFTPRARELFIKGKQLELERYLKRYNNNYSIEDPLPIGHPYVFQNDTEFAAGYLEMFFRNPNYFAKQNSTLYNAYVELFQQDPSHAWKQDFQFYVNENRKFYLESGQKPWENHLTIPPQ